MLGHASAAMTLDVYAGLFSDDLDDVADRMDSLVSQTCHTGENGDATSVDRAGPQAPELHKRRVGPVGLEPTTYGLKVRCSTS